MEGNELKRWRVTIGRAQDGVGFFVGRDVAKETAVILYNACLAGLREKSRNDPGIWTLDLQRVHWCRPVEQSKEPFEISKLIFRSTLIDGRVCNDTAARYRLLLQVGVYYSEGPVELPAGDQIPVPKTGMALPPGSPAYYFKELLDEEAGEA